MQHAMDLIDDLNAHTPPPPMLDRKFCHAVDNADYPGSVVKWGADHLQVGAAGQADVVMGHRVA